jgi:hypothetical protein
MPAVERPRDISDISDAEFVAFVADLRVTMGDAYADAIVATDAAAHAIDAAADKGARHD